MEWVFLVIYFINHYFSFCIGIIKTFENDWLINYFPQDQYIFDLLDEQLEYIFETIKNVVT